MGLEVQPRTTAIGAELRGLDLAIPLADADFEALQSALDEHMVLFLRDQAITPEIQRDIALRFGEIERHPGVVFGGLRSDDVFKLMGQVMDEPAEIGLRTAVQIAVAIPLIAVSMFMSAFLAFLTYAAGHVFATRVLRMAQQAPPRSTQ